MFKYVFKHVNSISNNIRINIASSSRAKELISPVALLDKIKLSLILFSSEITPKVISLPRLSLIVRIKHSLIL